MLANLRAKLTGSVNRFSGRKDFLEAVCASAALIAIADGEIEEKEEVATIKAIRANPQLSAAFSARDIEQTAERMFERAKGGRMGRLGLYREIEEIAKDAEMSELVLVAALDVSESDGQEEPEEKVVIQKIANILHLNPADLSV